MTRFACGEKALGATALTLCRPALMRLSALPESWNAEEIDHCGF